MGLYNRYVLPRLINVACGQRPMARQREKIVPQAAGRVLEVGFGSGLNLPYYQADRIEQLFALEPAAQITALAAERMAAFAAPVELLQAGAESIPLDDASVDTVVMTYTLCTVADATASLSEMRRVLKPGGALLFTEHGAAPDAAVRRWQDRINTPWSRLAGGCNLNRDIAALLGAGGFRLDDVQTLYLPGWRPLTWNVFGQVSAPPR